MPARPATTTCVRRLAARAARTRAPMTRASCSHPFLPSQGVSSTDRTPTVTGRERWQTVAVPPESITRPAPRLLVLWDVDHTLIETRGVGRAIYDRDRRRTICT